MDSLAIEPEKGLSSINKMASRERKRPEHSGR
jgi:hypothetical protein